jgi:hypothetical protein
LSPTREQCDLIEEIGITVGQLADMHDYEEVPFRSNDDVTLLSYGFKYQNSLMMYGRDKDNVPWTVRLDSSVPQWYRDGKKVGGLSYDRVVQMFSPPKLNRS